MLAIVISAGQASDLIALGDGLPQRAAPVQAGDSRWFLPPEVVAEMTPGGLYAYAAASPVATLDTPELVEPVEYPGVD